MACIEASSAFGGPFYILITHYLLRFSRRSARGDCLHRDRPHQPWGCHGDVLCASILSRRG